MNKPAQVAATMVDAVFPVTGTTLERSHAHALRAAVLAHLPWLEHEAGAGIHPLKLVTGNESVALLSRRVKLLLRVPATRFSDLTALVDTELSVRGHAVRLGEPLRRELLPHATLYAYRVAAEDADELAFMAHMTKWLDAAGIAGERVCGKLQRHEESGQVLHTFSAMLHGLPADQSLRLQEQGLGPHRLLGCGIFVPHKSAAAVGASQFF
ncbi:MAG: type I-MYXAN CRISPR-associated protein Cas6/Cmx6 [Rhodoferax sp.]|nr:type I-MYXAN CRISPR-associated protein Cas6/Cmx6 [Rhodoferax sp.]